MPNFRWFHISCDIFGGFKKLVDLDYMESVEDVIIYVINQLTIILQEANLTILLEKISNLNFHIHDFTFGDILMGDHNIVYYICSHC